MLLLELILASSLILQSYGYCITRYMLLTKLVCINNFCHTLCIIFVCGCVILPLETLPPGDQSGGVVYLRIVLSPEEASHLMGNS